VICKKAEEVRYHLGEQGCRTIEEIDTEFVIQNLWDTEDPLNWVMHVRNIIWDFFILTA
jgi:hypothetical protein